MNNFKFLFSIGYGVAAGLAQAANPLAGLPSSTGATVAAIQALGDNQWLQLDSAAADPQWGTARGRSWGGEGFVFIPELRGAFLTGEGVHAYVKPDGFGQDDFWFYDINANRWICLYPGTDTQNFNLLVTNGKITVDSAGRALDSTGNVMPAHLLIHSWAFVSYDPDQKKIRFAVDGGPFGRYYMPGGTAVEAGITALESQGLNKSGYTFGPWAYNIQTGTFERELSINNARGAGSYSGFPLFQYIPTKKQFFLGGASDVAFYDPAAKSWSVATDQGTRPSGYDFGGCYDPTRDKVFMGQNPGNFFNYDIQTNTWKKLSSAVYDTPAFSSNYGGVNYDAGADRVIIFDFWSTKTVRAYNPASDTWETASAIPSGFSETNGTFYDPVLGVHFVFTAGDSRDDSRIWVYRYKGPGTGVEGKGQRVEGRGQIQVSPNPVTNRALIRTDGPARISIFDPAGRRVAVLRSGTVWNTKTLSAGVYTARYNSAKGTASKRFVLVR